MTIVKATSFSARPDAATDIPNNLRAALDAWQTLSDTENGRPSWTTMRFLDVTPPLLPWAVLVQHDEECDDFRILYWGSRRNYLHRADFTGAFVMRIRPVAIGEKAGSECAETRLSASPLLFRVHLETDRGGQVEHVKLYLPFYSPDRRAPDRLLWLVDPASITNRMYRAWDVEPPVRFIGA